MRFELVLFFVVLGLSIANEPIQDDRNEVLINWHNDQGEAKSFKIDDVEKDNGHEKIHSKTLLQKYYKTSSAPCGGSSLGSSSAFTSDSGNFGSLQGSSSGYGSSGSIGSSSVSSGCGSGSGCDYNNCGSCNNYGCSSGNSCAGYGGNDYGLGCATGGYSSNTGYGSGALNTAFGSGIRGGDSAYGYGSGSAAYGAGFGGNYGGCSGVLGTRDYNGVGYYDGASCGNGKDLSYEQLCKLINKENAARCNRANARKYLRGNKAARDSKNFNSGSQIDKVLKENERNCLIDACDAAKIASGDSRNDNCYRDQQNSHANEMKRIHNLVKSADRKNEHLNMNEKAKDNLHSHKRVVTEFDKLEHFKKCSENCKDAEKGRRANVNKANAINKNQRRRKGHSNRRNRFRGNSSANQKRNKNEFNYYDTNNRICNNKSLRNKRICDSDNDYTNADSSAASCASDENRSCSNSLRNANSCKYGKYDKCTDYDYADRNRNCRDRIARCNRNRENRDVEYPYVDEGCGDGYEGCNDTCDDGFY